jgi:LysM repeat protein
VQTQQAGGATPAAVPTEVASNWIEPVITVTPNAYGELVHEVKYGQYLWLIADTYGTTVDEIKTLNDMWWDSIYVGNHILIPTPEWYALTPTITKTPTGEPVDPVILATQSTAEAKFTPTPTFTRTMLPGQATDSPVDPGDSSPPPEEVSMGSMILVVFGITAVVILITFLQPWKPKQEPEREDPLKTKVE